MTNSQDNGGRLSFEGRPLLYSERFRTISTLESALRGSQIFTGDQPDDFAVAGMVDAVPSVLVLGAGVGSAIRAILAANPRARVTVVDNSATQLSVLTAIFAEYFPEVSFEAVFDDAESLGGIGEARLFDVVCVDIYDGNVYPPFVLDSSWWQWLRRTKLAPDGVLLVNAWGIPTHLEPFRGGSLQASFLAAIGGAFGRLEAHASRRNVTICTPLAKGRDIDVMSSIDHLVKVDQLWLRLLRQRFTSGQPTLLPADVAQGMTLEVAQRGGAHLDALMNEAWPEAVEANREFSQSIEIERDSSVETLLSSLLAVPRPARDLYPNLWSVEQSEYGDFPHLFLRLTQMAGRDLLAADPEWYINVWLTQFAAVILKATSGFAASATYEECVQVLEIELDHLERK